MFTRVSMQSFDDDRRKLRWSRNECKVSFLGIIIPNDMLKESPFNNFCPMGHIEKAFAHSRHEQNPIYRHVATLKLMSSNKKRLCWHRPAAISTSLRLLEIRIQHVSSMFLANCASSSPLFTRHAYECTIAVYGCSSNLREQIAKLAHSWWLAE